MSTTVELQQLLSGNESDARQAYQNIQQQMTRYGEKFPEKSKIYQLQYGVKVLHSICLVADGADRTHYDVYKDIILEVLAPFVQPQSSPSHWSRYLEFISYYHNTMLRRKQFEVASQIFQYVVDRLEDLVLNTPDYKSLLSICSARLISLRTRVPLDEVPRNEEVRAVVRTMAMFYGLLLEHIDNLLTQRCKPLIIEEFLNILFPRRTPSVLAFLKNLPLAEKQQMLSNFLILLKELNWSSTESEEKEHGCPLYILHSIDAIEFFWRMDVAGELQEQNALVLLRIIRAFPALQQQQDMLNYTISLLYYFIKVFYARQQIENFQAIFQELCRKCVNCFERSLEHLNQPLKSKWFPKIVKLWNLLLDMLQQRPRSVFSMFWQQMNTVECYKSYAQVLKVLMKLSKEIPGNEDAAGSGACCTSVWKHLILSYLQLLADAYLSLVEHVQLGEVESSNLIALHEVHEIIFASWAYALPHVKTMDCLKENSKELKFMLITLTQIAKDVVLRTQKEFCLHWAEQLSEISHKFGTNAWSCLLRRLYKMWQAEDPQKADELHCYFIAALISENKGQWPNWHFLRMNVNMYYEQKQPPSDKTQCLVETWHRGESPLKPRLALEEYATLRWLDQQCLLKYFNSNKDLLASLLRFTQEPYHRLLIIKGGNLTREHLTELTQLRDDLSRNYEKLGRFELLTLAMARSALMLNHLDSVFKNGTAVETKGSVEDQLIELIGNKELALPNSQAELQLVHGAKEALDAYRKFYEQADVELITGHMSNFIDWEFILDSLQPMASYLQMAGYIEYAAQAWYLHYRIATTLEDHMNSLRSLAFFCEYAEYVERLVGPGFDLQREIEGKEEQILSFLQNLSAYSQRKRSWVLVALCHMAYYHAMQRNYVYMEVLFQLVLKSQEESNTGKFDLVNCTYEATKLRIQRKLLYEIAEEADGSSCLSFIEHEYFSPKTLIDGMEHLVSGVSEWAHSCGVEAQSLLAFLLNTLAEVSECSGHRLMENFALPFFCTTLKCAIQYGLALRVIQLLSWTTYNHLQMEFMGKASIQLELIECVLGTAPRPTMTEDAKSSRIGRYDDNKATTLRPCDFDINLNMDHWESANTLDLASSIQVTRRVAPAHVSPFKVMLQRDDDPPDDKTFRKLRRFLQYELTDCMLPEVAELWKYTAFTVACLYARFCYLARECDELDDFYVAADLWLNERKASFLKDFHSHVLLLYNIHYINYLRALGQPHKALEVIDQAMELFKASAIRMDAYFYINLMVQRNGTLVRLQEALKVGGAGVSRKLNFNILMEEDHKWSQRKLEIKQKLIQQASESSVKTKRAKEHYNKNRLKPMAIDFNVGDASAKGSEAKRLKTPSSGGTTSKTATKTPGGGNLHIYHDNSIDSEDGSLPPMPSSASSCSSLSSSTSSSSASVKTARKQLEKSKKTKTLGLIKEGAKDSSVEPRSKRRLASRTHKEEEEQKENKDKPKINEITSTVLATTSEVTSKRRITTKRHKEEEEKDQLSKEKAQRVPSKTSTSDSRTLGKEKRRALPAKKGTAEDNLAEQFQKLDIRSSAISKHDSSCGKSPKRAPNPNTAFIVIVEDDEEDDDSPVLRPASARTRHPATTTRRLRRPASQENTNTVDCSSSSAKTLSSRRRLQIL